MPATTKVPLGESVLARRWYLDVNTGTYASPVWTGVFGVEDFKPSVDPSVQDDSDFDSGGWKSSTVSALAWSMDLKLARKVTDSDATVYDPGQEALRAAAGTMGISNVVDVRWYEMTSGGPKVEAYRGYAAVTWTEDGGSQDALATVSCKLTGKGARTAITHPDGAQAKAEIYSITPSAAAAGGGTLVEIHGTNFMLAGVDDVVATTGITLGGTNFTSWIVESNNVIFAVTPAKAAGTYTVVITNSAGASTVNQTITTS